MFSKVKLKLLIELNVKVYVAGQMDGHTNTLDDFYPGIKIPWDNFRVTEAAGNSWQFHKNQHLR